MVRKPYGSTIGCIGVDEPSSTTITSKSGYRRRDTPSRQSRMVRCPLYVQTKTEMLGQSRVAEKGTSAKAWQTVSSAGFCDRSRRVSPKSQSWMSWPPRFHSSGQENTKDPAHPRAHAV